jgi:hypothetical protein
LQVPFFRSAITGSLVWSVNGCFSIEG